MAVDRTNKGILGISINFKLYLLHPVYFVKLNRIPYKSKSSNTCHQQLSISSCRLFFQRELGVVIVTTPYVFNMEKFVLLVHIFPGQSRIHHSVPSSHENQTIPRQRRKL
ncbi:uncharacterized protein LOC132037625 [Lycium ferocissimum]|uniref:uncharacterized protein LOC132037625 n=1 Tax=Lycium ferocissimum TaxID=112874 RepID=UPI0028160D97|nr:uncharacterized protein LOC132037625 [Lycium ferocissimum]